MIEKLMKLVYLNWINRLIGAILGGISVVLILSTLFWLTNKIDLLPEQLKSESILFSYIESTAPAVYAYTPILKVWFAEVEAYFASYIK
jgi:uncharacterized membrane protein required for colicin V production